MDIAVWIALLTISTLSAIICGYKSFEHIDFVFLNEMSAVKPAILWGAGAILSLYILLSTIFSV